MNEDVEPYLSKARECLAGAQSELLAGRYNNAASRAYYAAYNAAIVALVRAGRTSRNWGHDEVQAAFAGHLVHRRKLYPTVLRAVLSELAIVRIRADYGLRTASAREARRALEDARRFVQAIERRQS